MEFVMDILRRNSFQFQRFHCTHNLIHNMNIHNPTVNIIVFLLFVFKSFFHPDSGFVSVK
uniref:Uncharacterized protein n=1 Tax=Octopus bimaculoides TaxID=37653 RepID=A0A0L8G5T7_OCTBM